MTLHELYVKHGAALGCVYYSRFRKLWPKVCALLDAPARYEYAVHAGMRVEWANRHESSAAECIKKASREVGYGMRRIVLLDGTVIREWGAK